MRKTIGTILMILGGLGIIVLLTGGGPVFPHVTGPITLAVGGTLILTLKGKTK